MRKIFSLLIALVLCFSFVCANAKMPEELEKVLTEEKYNFTLSADIKLSNAEFSSLVDFAKEILGEEYTKIENFVDLELMLESLFTTGATLDMQADISKDFKKMNFGITGETNLKLQPNGNLEVNAKGNFGMWLNMDITGDEPVYRIILKAPCFNKYAVVDLLEIMGEEEKAEFLNSVKAYKDTYSDEFIKSLNGKIIEAIDKNATIKKNANKYTISVDNAGFVSLVKDLFGIILDVTAEQNHEMFAEDPEVAKAMAEMIKASIPSFSGITLIGEKGAKVEYVLLSKNIKTITEFDHIKIDIPSIFKSLGMEWNFKSQPVISFEMKAVSNYSLYDKTKVEFPVLTEDNSFDLLTAFDSESYVDEDYVEEDNTPEYPFGYFSYDPEKIFVKDDMIYVPLRYTLETAYAGNIAIGFENGVITMTSEYFTEYDKITMVIGENNATIDGETFETSPLIMEDGVTYISDITLIDLFAMEISEAYYDFLGGYYWVSVWSY